MAQALSTPVGPPLPLPSSFEVSGVPFIDDSGGTAEDLDEFKVTDRGRAASRLDELEDGFSARESLESGGVFAAGRPCDAAAMSSMKYIYIKK